MSAVVSAARRYWMLVASLPHLHKPDTGALLPIGRERLRARLSLLEAHDLSLVEQWWTWRDALDAAAPGDDAGALAGWRRIASGIRSPEVGAHLAEWVRDRTFVAALRDRRAGRSASAAHWREVPGAAQCLRHWDEPLFACAARHPWLLEVERLTNAADAAGLRDLLEAREWRAASCLRTVDRFGFASVAGWWLQWRIVERRQRERDASLAARMRRWIEVAARGAAIDAGALA